MSTADEACLILLLTGLFGLLIFWRLRFPNAPRRIQTLVLAGATVLFFLIYDVFPAQTIHHLNPLVILNSDVAHPSNTRASRIR